MSKRESFVFGMSVQPLWFRRKVLEKRVDYEYGMSGRIESCRYYTLNGEERCAYIGDEVSYWDFYTSEEFLNA